MDFGGLLILGLIWLVFNVLGRRKPDETTGARTRLPLPPARRPQAGDATQREGSRLEILLRELERALDQGGAAGGAGGAGRPAGVPSRVGRPADVPLTDAEDVEERESLEVEEKVVSLEQDVARAERPHISQDDTASALVARRIAAAEARSGTLRRADHAAFDQRIRAEPADATAVRRLSPDELRRAVVWREILGPPVSLRDDPS